MIDARELRIGNWVKYTTGEEGQVISITEYGAAITLDREYMGADEYDPIHLNPEILEKCGFKYADAPVHAYADSKHMCYEHKNGGVVFIPFCTSDADCHIHIQYLHQLQNLYYSLTNTELNFIP